MKSASTSRNAGRLAVLPDGLSAIRVGGFQPFTTLDYPGQMAAVVFLQGCPLRCVYCHNPDLLPVHADTEIDGREIAARLKERRGLLQAVVFSGGEPLVQSGLAAAMDHVRSLGFKVGLHTSGISPDRFQRLRDRVDWVGFDIKAPFSGYGGVTGVNQAGRRAEASFAMLAAWGIPYEVRVTIWPSLIDCDAVRQIATEVHRLGCKDFALQECRDPATGEAMGGAAFLDEDLQADLAQRFPGFSVRRASHARAA
jgi:pyruvate formate lyase activating enzyme